MNERELVSIAGSECERFSQEYGVALTIADLGDWGKSELRSEYDPNGPIIRINSRVLNSIQGNAREQFIARAIAHEIYHHRERIGAIERAVPHADREMLADRFATEHLHEFMGAVHALLLGTAAE